MSIACQWERLSQSKASPGIDSEHVLVPSAAAHSNLLLVSECVCPDLGYLRDSLEDVC
jgi:hypothetical protein